MNTLRRNKSVIFVLLTTMILTTTILYFNVYKFYGYKVSRGGNTITFVKSRIDFNKTYREFKSELKSKYSNATIIEDFTLTKVKVDDADSFMNNDELKKVMLKKFNIVVDAFLMKSDNRKVADVTSEKQGKAILNSMQDDYKRAKLTKTLKTNVENKISYEPVKVKIGSLHENSEIISEIAQYNIKDKTPLITVKEVNSGIKKIKILQSESITSPSRGHISSGFGTRWGKMHKGIDIAANFGESIDAVLDGTITYSAWEDGYGNVIKINNGCGIETMYAHCSVIVVKKGDIVKEGMKIGEVGSTGHSTGPHLHFELRVNGEPKNPEKYIR
ncbi:M23 family metallopeptidase [Clostridium frigoris]|uniref:M23 family metallopeptidase n=1 Tax=Clostridium frigoris TaxID=205327 RepID=A0ABS6BPV0_9CLOT|nr:M23 family metallopeptidase [Clostridium frigoris]MBU3158945.1 M23 family metallopeptidase [Clostridium frigoris]